MLRIGLCAIAETLNAEGLLNFTALFGGTKFTVWYIFQACLLHFRCSVRSVQGHALCTSESYTTAEWPPLCVCSTAVGHRCTANFLAQPFMKLFFVLVFCLAIFIAKHTSLPSLLDHPPFWSADALPDSHGNPTVENVALFLSLSGGDHFQDASCSRSDFWSRSTRTTKESKKKWSWRCLHSVKFTAKPVPNASRCIVCRLGLLANITAPLPIEESLKAFEGLLTLRSQPFWTPADTSLRCWSSNFSLCSHFE